MSKPLSWSPRRRGNTYCSPACGYNCTIQHFRQAKKAGADLAHILGPGWRADVWENLGWHYAAMSPERDIRVMKGKSNNYIAFLNGDCGEGATPEHAVLAVIQTTIAELHRQNKILSRVQSIYEEMKERVKAL